MQVLVTGASGLLGANLVRELLRDGHQVRAMVRSTSDTRGIDGLAAERVIAAAPLRSAETYSVPYATSGSDTTVCPSSPATFLTFHSLGNTKELKMPVGHPSSRARYLSRNMR